MALTIKKTLLPAGVNHRARRDGWEPDTLVIHVTEGNAASVRSWFNNPAAGASSNYFIPLEGLVEQFVEESMAAYGQGKIVRPTAQVVLDRPGVNPNDYCLSIEHEGTGTKPLTPAQLKTSVQLIREICTRNPKIRFDRRHIIGHHEIRADKSCPGKIDVDELVRLAKGDVPEPVPVHVDKPQVVWSNTVGDWLVVVQVNTDTDWYYVPLRRVRELSAVRAVVPLSRMPQGPS